MNELDFLVKTAYGYIEDEDDRLEDFVGENDFDHAMYYALSKLKKINNFIAIADYLQKMTNISEAEAFKKGRKVTRDTYKEYIICEGYIAFVKEGKYKKQHIGIMKNE